MLIHILGRSRSSLGRKALLACAIGSSFWTNAAYANPTGCQPSAEATPAIQALRRNFFNADINALTFHSIASIFNTVPVKAGGSPSPLASAPRPLDFDYRFNGESHKANAVLERTFTNALLILKDGKIVYENYRNLTGPKTQFLSMSTAKSITSILVGVALEAGQIKSLNDQVTAYIPELKGTAFDGATIEDLLQMKSGVDREDNYQPKPDSPSAKLREETMVLNCRRSVEEVFMTKRADEPGKTFRYSTLNTNVLGWVLERATGKPVNEYMSEKLWKPMGAESDGFFLTDGPSPVGRPTNGMGFNGVARDYARIGMMMLNQGKVGDKQIVSPQWVKQSTVPTGPEPADAKELRGYQYQWWTLTNSNAYTAIGLQGQFIFVDPDTRTVIVKLSYFPQQNQDAYEETEAFFRAASLWSASAR